MSHVGPHAPPFFVLHGTNDSLVPVEQARTFVDDAAQGVATSRWPTPSCPAPSTRSRSSRRSGPTPPSTPSSGSSPSSAASTFGRLPPRQPRHRHDGTRPEAGGAAACPSQPRSRLTARVRRDVLADRAALRLVAARSPRPRRFGPRPRRRRGLRGARALRREGLDPGAGDLHRTPPLPDSIRTRRARSANHRYTSLTWLDEYEVPAEEPGAARYAEHRSNRLARAALVEHRASRPWLVCVHGFGMGSPGLDLAAFRAQHLRSNLGLNVAFPVLPFHGRRNPGGARSAPAVPGIDVLDNLHGMAQAVWDVRQLLRLLRERTDQPIGLMGLSLGGAVAADRRLAGRARCRAPARAGGGSANADGGPRRAVQPRRGRPAIALAERSRVVMAPVSPLAL